MRKIFWVAMLMTASSGAIAQTKTYDGGNSYTLQGCARIANSGVECTFRVVNNRQDGGAGFRPELMNIISPTGRERNLSDVFLNTNQVGRFGNATYRQGITYQLRVTFSDFPENMIRYFDFDGTRWENILVRATTAAPAPTPAPATPVNARTTTALPGQAEWRQRVRLDNVNYMAVVHGCFRAAANATTASCLVSLLAENPSGTVGASGNTVLYGATLVQFNGQAITNNAVNLQVGDSLIRAIPVR